MKKLSIFIITGVLTLSLIGYSKTDNLAKVEKQAGTYIKLAGVEKSAAGIKQIKELYQGDLTQVLKDANKILPGLKAETDDYMAKAETESNKAAYLQGVEKGLQIAFTALMKKSLNDVERSSNANSALNNLKLAKIYYKVIEITAKRRGSLFNDERKFSNLFVSMFNALEDRIKAKDKIAITSIKKQIFDLTDSVYFLCVLYEVKGLIELRGKDEPDKLFVKQVEGIVFFNNIKNSAKDAEAAAIIEAEFKKPASDINTALIMDNLKIAYPEFAAEFKEQF